MKDKKYNFIYKTTNLTNGMFYYGVHSTDDLEDGYLGSGLFLCREIKKFGKQNFKREIVKMFDNKDQAYEYENQVVNEEMTRNPLCYNLAVGGCGGKLREDYSFKKGPEYRKKISDGVKRYYESEEGRCRRKQIKEERRIYWESEEGQKMKQRISENNKRYYESEEGKQTQKRRIEKVRRVGRSEESKNKHRERMKQFWSSERGKIAKENFSKNYSGCNAAAWNTGSRYDVIDIIDSKIILSDKTLREVESYFGASVFPNSYIKHDLVYRKRYKFIARPSHK